MMLLHIHYSNLIEDIDDPDEDAQSCGAWAYLIQQDKLTLPVICEVQKIITQNQEDLEPHQKGYTRSTTRINVYIGKKVAPTWWMVDNMLDNWILDMQSWKDLDPKTMHIRFEHIHPFCDGNGRTGRMLMWWHERKLGREPTLIDIKDRYKYYRWFK